MPVFFRFRRPGPGWCRCRRSNRPARARIRRRSRAFSLGSSMISGPYSPRSSWAPTCEWKSRLRRQGRRSCSERLPVRHGVLRQVGTPSMSLTMAMPCQCPVTSCGMALVNSACSRSPFFSRISWAGTSFPYAHVRRVTPSRSMLVSPAARVRSGRGAAPVVAIEQAASQRRHPPTAPITRNCRRPIIFSAWHFVLPVGDFLRLSAAVQRGRVGIRHLHK